MRDTQMDQFVRGELSPAEARELAQASLEDPELFDQLTNCAVAKQAAAIPRPRTIPFPRRVLAIAAAAAVAAAFSVYFLRSPKLDKPAILAPALASAANPGAPILLAANLQPANSGQVFRSGDADQRAPRAEGSIVSGGDGISIDLGSVDGIAKGSLADVLRGGRQVARLEITTVLRERSRARIAEGAIRTGDRVQVPPPAFFGALLERAETLSPNSAAREAAEKAIDWAQKNQLSLAPEALNTIGVLRALAGDYDAAAAPLTEALTVAKDADFASVANNLGVLAELRGDRAKAESHYSDALRAANEQDRGAIEKNLARVKASH